MYIQTMNLNGTEYKKNYLRHEDLLKGGNINFQMGSQPNLNRSKNVVSLLHPLLQQQDGNMLVILIKLT